MRDRTKFAISRTNISQNQKCSRASHKTLTYIGTERLGAYGIGLVFIEYSFCGIDKFGRGGFDSRLQIHLSPPLLQAFLLLA